jgi:phosphatidylethanolamine/phosphatidyl-N-methylethanolamine N-methyltransferase
MGHPLPRQLTTHLSRNFRFIKGLVSQPRSVGAIVPTSVYMARRMASVANAASGLPVLELGPGTGVVTRALIRSGISPRKIVAIEYSSHFARHLRADFPDITLIEGDAFRLEAALAGCGFNRFDCVISGLPLLNFGVRQRISLVEDCLRRIPPGRPMIQFSYGPVSPVPEARGHYTVEHFGLEIRNIPPARMWIYRRAG